MLLNEEQRLLQQTIKEFLDDNSPVENIRTLRDNPLPKGYDEQLWQQMVELGVSGLGCSEVYGGFGFGAIGLGAIMEEMGKHLTASPLFSTVIMASNIFECCGSDAQKEQWLSAIASGSETFAVAIEEDNHFAPLNTELTLHNGRLTGKKVFVMEASGAQHFLVLIRLAGLSGEPEGLAWALLDRDCDGLTIKRHHMMDGRDMCSLTFDNVAVSSKRLLNDGKSSWQDIALALDKSTIMLAAEMLGGSRELLNRTVGYLCEREQFDVKIGTFQALQHRCAQMLCQLELAQSALQKALSMMDHGVKDLSTLASQVKYMANDCYKHISNEAVQMHGGMGITDELEIGLFLKRARVCMQMLGDSSYHSDRFATAHGF